MSVTVAQELAELRRANAELRAALAQRNSEYGERIEQQAATVDVLKAMSASPDDALPVFRLVVERARAFCEADGASLALLKDDMLHLQAYVGDFFPDYEADFPRQVSSATMFGRAVLACDVVQMPDVSVDSAHYTREKTDQVQRAIIAVPLLRAGAPIGAIAIGRRRSGEFSTAEVELLRTFAEQAVMAITSAETYRALQARTADLQQSLEYQTATSDVLKVINRSTFDLKPVLVMVAETAARLCVADQAALFRYDGGTLYLAANCGFPPDYEAHMNDIGPRPLGEVAQTVSHRAILERRIIQIPDIATVPGYPDVPINLGKQRTSLGVPLIRESEPIGVILLARQRVQPFTDRQIELVSTFADQAVIAIENTRLVTEQREALEQQTAMAEVLEAINTSPGNLGPVIEAITDKAKRLTEAEFSGLYTYDGDFFPLFYTGGDIAMDPLKAEEGSALAELVAGASLVHIPDVADTDAYRAGIPSRVLLVEVFRARTTLWIALRKDKALVGALAVHRTEVRPFTDKQIALLESFAAQAVIAMENARLLNEQREALEQQTATAEVLQVINASPSNLGPVFEVILDKAMQLCQADFGAIGTFDGELGKTVAHRGIPAAYADYLMRNPSPPDSGTAVGRIVRGESIVHIQDLMAEAAYRNGYPGRRAMVELGGARTSLSVALRKDETLLGMIAFYRQEVRPFSERQIALLENFAAQAVIAMENARLLTEQREALEQQTATAEVLQVINSSPGNLQPVFDIILDKAMWLCGAAFGRLSTWDGNSAQTVAMRGFPAALADKFAAKRPSSEISPGIARLYQTKRPSQVPDVMASEGYRNNHPDPRALADLGGVRTFLAVPLRKDEVMLGHIAVYRQEVRAFSDKEIALLESFAAQAVIAMENARLLDEVRQRQEELRITFENMGDGVAMFDESQRLVAWNSKFQEVFNLPDDLLEQHRTYEEYLRFLAGRGDFGAGVDTVEQIDELVASTGQPYGYERTRPDGRVIEIRRNPVPDGGFVLIFSDITERKRSEVEIRAARDAAEAAYRDLKAAQASLIQAEKMASLGQLTAGIAHEIKNPLNFVNNFASLSVDLLDELKQTAAPGLAVLDEARRAEVDELATTLASNLDKINEHGRRADGIVRGMLEHSRGGSGERREVEVNVLVDEALNLAYHGARAQDESFTVTLQREFAEGIAPITLAPQDVTRVLLNLLSNGFYAARERQRTEATADFEPTVRVSTRELDGQVEIRVRDNGIGIPAEIRDRLFQPFFTTKPPGEGTGLGLSMSYDIITQQHGGSLSADSCVGEYSEFTVRLPRTP